MKFAYSQSRATGRLLAIFTFGLFMVSAGFSAPAIARHPADLPVPVSVTLLHTNDMHSRYRPNRDALGLGGVARLKTLLNEIRSKNPSSLLVDGGDWSEGGIYYNLSAGTESLQMMNQLGYDVTVVGNHDWINGADVMLDAADRAKPSFDIVGANFNIDDYKRAADWKKRVLPYTIKDVGGVKVAFIGLVTYEFVFDSFVAPIKITSPYSLTRELAQQLRSKADAIVVISHNSVKTNEQLLKAAPDVDMVVGAHDHLKLTKPSVVAREGRPDGWVVEAGAWGQYLGQVEMKIIPRAAADAAKVPSVQLVSYKLNQVDSRLAEDPEINATLDRLEASVEKRYGPIFDDSVGENSLYINRLGPENLVGNLAADAYRRVTDSDFALDQSSFIYGEMHPGTLHTIDVFHTNPAVYNPVTQKSWTLQTFKMQGKTLNWLLNLLFFHPKGAEFGILSASGLQMTYNPSFRGLPLPVPGSGPVPGNGFFSLMPGSNLGATELSDVFSPPYAELDGGIREILINGRKLDPVKVYKVAAGGGIILSIKFLNGLLPNAIPLDGLVDTGLEDWRIMLDYLKFSAPINSEKIAVGNRVRSQQPDLAILHSDVSWQKILPTEGGMLAKVRAVVRNFGMTPTTEGAMIRLYGNRNRSNTAVDEDFVQIGDAKPIPALKPQESYAIEWEGTIPGDRGLFPVYVRADVMPTEVNTVNNLTERWFVSNESAVSGGK